MESASETSNGKPKLLIGCVVVLALYLVSYFPVFSYLVRNPEHQRYAAVYRPIPHSIRAQMLRVWLRLDPTGAEITNRAFEEHRAAAGLTK